MSAAALPLFGRRYQLLVKFPKNDQGEQTVLTITDSSFEPEALRITFDVYTVVRATYWYADIVIYNLDEATVAQIMGNHSNGPSGVEQGMEVILSAGYLSGNYGVIWDGYVMQPMWDRENVTDYKLTLHCVIGLGDTRNYVNKTYDSIGQRDLVARIAQDSFRPIPIETGAISTRVDNKASSRAYTVFGNPLPYVDSIAADNNMLNWLTAKGINIADPNENEDVVSRDDLVVYTPRTGIIGTPVQTQDGANVRLLLDPRVQVKKPVMQIKIDNAIVRQIKKEAGDFGKIGLLDRDGQYLVAAVHHIGDTRGQAWYTEITGVTPELWKLVGAAIVQGGA